MTNNLWTIIFGDYDFQIDRKTLVYSLTETKTGTCWADNLSVGSIELENRHTGERTRHPFSETKLVTLSEKSGSQGKRILFGLEIFGIPIDVYFTCALREIQLTVEANRDSKTHSIIGLELLPRLCTVPEDTENLPYLVVPNGEGTLLFASDVPQATVEQTIWDRGLLTMPFFGAVRGKDAARTALDIIHDSAYASLQIIRQDDGSASADIRFAHDPERRRLDVRIVPMPGEDHIGIARAYREKLVGERLHIPLRRKMREQPALENLIGAALLEFPIQQTMTGNDNHQSFQEVAEIAQDLHETLGVDRALCLFSHWGTGTINNPLTTAGDSSALRETTEFLQSIGYKVGICEAAIDDLPAIQEQYHFDALFIDGIGEDSLQDIPTRWDDMEERLNRIGQIRAQFPLFGTTGGGDWSAIACDFWRGVLSDPEERSLLSLRLPLQSVVYHDSVMGYGDATEPLEPNSPRTFLRTLLRLAPPSYTLDYTTYFDAKPGLRDYIARTYAVLSPLHRLSFPAFLTRHRFLDKSGLVQEAHYSNGTRVVVNFHDSESYKEDTLTLLPFGFYAGHPQFIAHDALRVDSEIFEMRAFRIRTSQDGTALSQSTSVSESRFLVS